MAINVHTGLYLGRVHIGLPIRSSLGEARVKWRIADWVEFNAFGQLEDLMIIIDGEKSLKLDDLRDLNPDGSLDLPLSPNPTRRADIEVVVEKIQRTLQETQSAGTLKGLKVRFVIPKNPIDF